MENVWSQERAGCDIGGISIDRVVDIERLSYPHKTLIPSSDRELLCELSKEMGPRLIHPESLDLSLSFHSFLIRTEKNNILVDACCGNGKQRLGRLDWHERDGPFLDNLKALGVMPEDIDYVMCTHLHPDHVGWNTTMENGRWVPTFPNAQYLFAETEYKFWVDQQSEVEDPILHGSHADSVLPVVASGQATLVKADHQIEAGLNFEPAPGHTPGAASLNAESNDAAAVLCGDVVHHPVQVRRPDWSSAFCEDPAGSARSRAKLLERISGTGTLLLPAHFMSPYFGPIEKFGTGYKTVI